MQFCKQQTLSSTDIFYSSWNNFKDLFYLFSIRFFKFKDILLIYTYITFSPLTDSYNNIKYISEGYIRNRNIKEWYFLVDWTLENNVI